MINACSIESYVCVLYICNSTIVPRLQHSYSTLPQYFFKNTAVPTMTIRGFTFNERLWKINKCWEECSTFYLLVCLWFSNIIFCFPLLNLFWILSTTLPPYLLNLIFFFLMSKHQNKQAKNPNNPNNTQTTHK